MVCQAHKRTFRELMVNIVTVPAFRNNNCHSGNESFYFPCDGAVCWQTVAEHARKWRKHLPERATERIRPPFRKLYSRISIASFGVTESRKLLKLVRGKHVRQISRQRPCYYGGRVCLSFCFWQEWKGCMRYVNLVVPPLMSGTTR
jgi:hypothetical protein